MDFRNSIVRVAYRPLADYGDVLSAAASDVFPSHLRGFEAFIGSEDWLVGSAGLTVADIVLYELADQVGAVCVCVFCPGALLPHSDMLLWWQDGGGLRACGPGAADGPRPPHWLPQGGCHAGAV